MERRLQLLRALAVELSQSKRAMASLDLHEMEKRTLEQESICAELAFASSEIPAIATCVRGYPESDQKQVLIDREMAAAAQDLTHAVRVHAALVRRSRRSIDVLMNVRSTCTSEYLNSSGAYPIARYF